MDENKITDTQRIADLKKRVQRLENALEGFFNDFRQRSDDYHGIDPRDRW